MAAITNNRSGVAGINSIARRTAFLRGLIRLESLTITGLALIMFALCAFRLFWFPTTWWIWLLLGAIGPLLLAWTNTRDMRSIRPMINTLLNEKCDARVIDIIELQGPVTRALHQHRTIQKLIAKRVENMAALSTAMDEWTTRIFHVANNLNIVLHDPTLLEQVRSTQPAMIDATPRNVVEALTQPAGKETSVETRLADDTRQSNLVTARDTVTGTLNVLSATIDSIVIITEVLRHARLLAMDRVRIAQIETLLLRELDVIGDVERDVARLADAYDIALVLEPKPRPEY